MCSHFQHPSSRVLVHVEQTTGKSQWATDRTNSKSFGNITLCILSKKLSLHISYGRSNSGKGEWIIILFQVLCETTRNQERARNGFHSVQRREGIWSAERIRELKRERPPPWAQPEGSDVSCRDRNSHRERELPEHQLDVYVRLRDATGRHTERRTKQARTRLLAWLEGKPENDSFCIKSKAEGNQGLFLGKEDFSHIFLN